MQFPFSRSTDTHIDLSSQDAFNEGAPFATFDRMRREDPMAWSEMLNGDKGFWSVTRHADLLELNRQVIVAADACGSRLHEHAVLAMDAMRGAGALVLPVETIIYHMMGRSGTPEFKALLPLFKE